MSFPIKKILFIYRTRNTLIELLTYLYLKDSSSFSMEPCILITYQNVCFNSKIFSIATKKKSHYGQYHNVDNILRQSDKFCWSPPSRLHYSDPIEDPLILYGHYLFQ